MQQPRLILVGGFLGAGKTTLLARAASRLARQGHRVGLITNDQAANLVDTAVLNAAVGSPDTPSVQEVSGGCFCCRFGNLVAALKELMTTIEPDIVFGEPVGSCTDLSATVLQPLKALYGDLFRIAPFSVLVDPTRLRESLALRATVGLSDRAGQDTAGQVSRGTFPENVLHIFRTQLDEADLILLNKADTVADAELGELRALLAERVPQTPVLAASALRGDGVEAWLDWVLADRPAGQHIAQVDYDVYADGEAELGWLNASIHLQVRQGPESGATSEDRLKAGLQTKGTDWRGFCTRLLGCLRDECRAASAEIAHVKLALTAAGCQIVANLTRNDGQPSVRGDATPSASDADLVVNARARTSPDRLRALFERALAAAAGDALRVTVLSIESFAPSRPQPTHRYSSVV